MSYFQSKLLVDTATRVPQGSDELVDVSELAAGDILTLTRLVFCIQFHSSLGDILTLTRLVVYSTYGDILKQNRLKQCTVNMEIFLHLPG